VLSEFDNLQDITKDKLDNKIQISGKFGIEKESLRIDNANLSKNPHSEKLGSALCNKIITTDFSESLIELVTPAFEEINQTLTYLDSIEHFVTNNNNESLWPLSMPPYIKSDEEIQIARYGKSNLAQLKRTYREGLSLRYGRMMQAIAGIHFNYSFSEGFVDFIAQILEISDRHKASEILYFRTLRNVKRFNWLILYLFGASPAVPKSFNIIGLDNVIELDDCYLMPYATSLRMSDIGYQNNQQSSISVSFDDLKSYTNDLLLATRTENKEFRNLSKNSDQGHSQLSYFLLQIEDEYYAEARPKSSDISEIRQLSKLKKYGIDYLELRSIDLNPFARTGIDISTMEFIEKFLIYCALKESPRISNEEQNYCNQNNLNVAKMGRNKELNLLKNGKRIKIGEWLKEILDEIQTLENQFEIQSSDSTNLFGLVENPELTLSGKIAKKLESQEDSFHSFGRQVSLSNKEFYNKKKSNDNPYWIEIYKECHDSLQAQIYLEKQDSIGFDEYYKNFMTIN
tara:strand:+ start:2444 stop:3985 length:1542 start_codon:yes stop_codon:yes gene_type:complete